MESWKSDIIQDMKEIEERAMVKRDLLSLILLSKDKGGRGVLFIDYSGQILYTSCGFANYLGYECNELIGANYLKYVIEQSQSQTVWDEHKKVGVLKDYKNRWRAKDGTIRDMKWTICINHNEIKMSYCELLIE